MNRHVDKPPFRLFHNLTAVKRTHKSYNRGMFTHWLQTLPGGSSSNSVPFVIDSIDKQKYIKLFGFFGNLG